MAEFCAEVIKEGQLKRNAMLKTGSEIIEHAERLMMSHSTQLIDSTLSAERAKSILSKLLTSKINFHANEKFSNEERFGEDREHSQKRISELTAEKSLLINWLDAHKGGDRKIKINCVIELEVID